MDWMILLSVLGLLTAALTAQSNEPHKIYIVKGETAKLPCLLVGSSNELVQWFRGTTILTSGSYVIKDRDKIYLDTTIPGEWNLRISRVDPSFAGIYTCKTRAGTLSVFELIIETKPIFDYEASTPDDIEFTEYHRAEIRCAFSGEPTPEITWYRGDSNTELGVKGPVLIIPRIDRFAADEYRCLARNKHGEHENDINVRVRFGPDVTAMESTVYASISEEVVMGCVVESYPLLSVNWTDNKGKFINASWKYDIPDKKDKDNHFPGGRFTYLRIKPSILSIHDLGEYKCVAIGDGIERYAVINLKNSVTENIIRVG